MSTPKYDRTFHFSFSEGASNDDKISYNISNLIGKPIIISEKMDGSNTSLEKDNCFARTHSGPPDHPSFDHIKALHANIKHLIPEGFQLFGENCFALHSIAYTELPGYFLLFNVRDLNKNIWLSWGEVEMWAEEIGVPTVPVLFKGTVFSEKELKTLIESLAILPSKCGGIREGVVVRVQEEFNSNEFSSCVMKFVCKKFTEINKDEHWKHKEIVKNTLKIYCE